MRFAITLLFAAVLFVSSAVAADSGKVIKVLPQYLDLQGRTALAPSLYDRDAYQAQLLAQPELRSGLVFHVQWKAAKGQYKIRVEARGSSQAKNDQARTWELPVERKGWFSQWTKVAVTGDEFKKLGTLSAWRVTLWNGTQQLGEQKSFLW